MSEAATSDKRVHSTLLQRLLALDEEIHRPVTRQALDALSAHTTGDVMRVLDVGAGTGAGAFALAERYPSAAVVAIDAVEELLAGIRRRAEHQGLSGRISTHRADLGQARLDVGVADLAWAANAIHEVADPAAAFANVFRSLRRGGVLAVMEMDAPPRVLPREHELLEHALRTAAGADGRGPDWSERIIGAGFDLVARRVLTSDRVLPADGPGGAYAALELRRLARHAPVLADRELAELRDLVGDLTGRHERLRHVRIRGTRSLWIARRP